MAWGSVREPLLQTEVVQSQEHRNQANDSRTARGGNGASQGEDKTAKGYSEHDEVPGTSFRVWKIFIHVISLGSSLVEIYRAIPSQSKIFKDRGRGARLVQRVEVNAGRAFSEEFLALTGGVFDPVLSDGLFVVAALFEFVQQ